MKKIIIRRLIILALIVMTCTFAASAIISCASAGKSSYIPAVVLIILTLVFITIYALNTAYVITGPIDRINLSNPDIESSYTELKPLIERIISQNEEMASQMVKHQEETDMSDKMRREFTANVTHELKTPLTSISGYSEILRDGLVKKSDVPKFAGKIYDEASRLITLVNDILRLSELDENNTDEKELKKIDLYDLSEKIISKLEPIASKNEITLSLTGSHATIKGHELILDEMIYNLIDNAIKYNVAGGKVDVNIEQFVDGIELSVHDTGIGIKTKDIDHIFERFYRVDKSHSKAIGGTGLGLSIVKHGAIFHNARIHVKSKPGKGTTISVTF